MKDNAGTANGGIDTSLTQTFTITIAPVNDEPNFTAKNPPAVVGSSGKQVVPGWATAFAPGAFESAQILVSYKVSNVSNPNLFSVPPTVDNAGTLQYTLASEAFGTTTFIVQVTDNGGTANGGVDTSRLKSFSLLVKPTTTTTLSLPSSALAGQSITLTAQVAQQLGAAGSFVGSSAVFREGTTTLGTVPVNAQGQATLSLSTLSVGSHRITADFSGNAEVGGSISVPGTITISRVSPAVTVVASVNPGTVTKPVTLTATFTVANGRISQIVGESVTFRTGSVVVGSGVIQSNGTAALTTANLPFGPQRIAATLERTDVANKAVSTALPLVMKHGTAVTVSHSQVGKVSTITLRVVPSSGLAASLVGQTVTLLDGTKRLANVKLNASGVGTFTTSALALGSHQLTANYAGTAAFHPSTTTQSVRVRKLSTVVVKAQYTSAPPGHSVIFTATVTGPKGTPTGTVTFTVNGRAVATVRLNSQGKAAFQSSFTTPAVYRIAATYLGDEAFVPNESLTIKHTSGGRWLIR